MSSVGPFTLSKEERICSRTLIEKLFNGGDSKSLSSFPLRVVYLIVQHTNEDVSLQVPVKMMVSVSKRHFRHAVKRNRVKRQIREAYRQNKYIVASKMKETSNQQLLLAFIWLSDELYDTHDVERHMQHVLKRIADKL